MKSLALLAFVWPIGCAPTDVVVAVHDGGMADKDLCTDDSHCRGNEFCARDSCNDENGHCERRQVSVDSTFSPVCGCDGVVYWNDSVRKQLGINMAGQESQPECNVGGLACSGPGTCPHGASCARESKTCTSDTTGACWQLPPNCPPPGGLRFVRCADTTTCAAACEAFRTEEPYQRLSSDECPH